MITYIKSVHIRSANLKRRYSVYAHILMAIIFGVYMQLSDNAVGKHGYHLYISKK
jgi:hypothetical protein